MYQNGSPTLLRNKILMLVWAPSEAIYLCYCIYYFVQQNFAKEQENKNSRETFENSRKARNLIHETNMHLKFIFLNVFGCVANLILLYYKCKEQILSFLREVNNLKIDSSSIETGLNRG